MVKAIISGIILRDDACQIFLEEIIGSSLLVSIEGTGVVYFGL